MSKKQKQDVKPKIGHKIVVSVDFLNIKRVTLWKDKQRLNVLVFIFQFYCKIIAFVAPIQFLFVITFLFSVYLSGDKNDFFYLLLRKRLLLLLKHLVHSYFFYDQFLVFEPCCSSSTIYFSGFHVSDPVLSMGKVICKIYKTHVQRRIQNPVKYLR